MIIIVIVVDVSLGLPQSSTHSVMSETL